MAEDNERSFYSKVAGVTFRNSDGTDRQRIIAQFCRPGIMLRCSREPDNPKDPNAVGVWMKTQGMARGVQIGYLNREAAEDVAPHLDQGDAVEIKVANVTGGDGDNLGVNILISLLDRPARRQPAADRRGVSAPKTTGCMVAILVMGGSLGLLLAIGFIGNLVRPTVDLATIKADVSSDEALVKSLDAMRATMGSHRKEVFNADLLFLAARYTSRATTAEQTHEYVKNVIGGSNAYQIHKMVEDMKGVRQEPL